MALANMISPFVWGPGGAQMTPEQIARQREIASALLNQAGDTSPVGSWTQGAARVVNALGGVMKERRANKAEAANAEGSQSRIAALLSGMTGGGAAQFPEAPSGAGGAPMAANGSAPSIPQTAEAGVIRQGLIDRGLPSHVADAFVLNMQDESGLNPGINERNPTVPGSRGGYGLYQLTGPRRKAYEAFAGQRGVDPSDTNAQLDFLMSELQGPEANAAKSIMAAPDTGTAATAIVNDFLRPAPENAAARANRYMSMAGQGAPVQVASNDPQAAIASALGNGSPQQAAPPLGAPRTVQDMPVAEAPQQMAQATPAQGVNPGMQAAIAQALSNPGASPQERQIATILLQQQMQNADPGNQLDMRYKQAQIDALTAKAQPQIPDSVQALDLRAQRAGLQPGTPAYNEFMVTGGGKGQTINVGGNNDIGAIPPGMMVTRDPQGNVTGMVQIPGGPAEAAANAAASVNSAAENNRATSSDVITGAANKIRALSKEPGATGLVGAGASYVPNSPAAELYRQVDVMKSNATIENLNAMRRESKTGGALGNVTEKEGDMLAAKSGALDPKSPYFQEQLDDYERTLLRIVHGKGDGDAIYEKTRQTAEPTGQTAPPQPGAVMDGYRFKGGDPSDQGNWEPVQ